MSGSRTRGGGKNVAGIPGACATRNFSSLAKGPWGSYFDDIVNTDPVTMGHHVTMLYSAHILNLNCVQATVFIFNSRTGAQEIMK